jgi:hypothetical protein
MRWEMRAPPLDAIGIRVIGRRVDEMQLIGELGQPGSRTSKEP